MCSSRSPTMIACRLTSRRSVTNTKFPSGSARNTIGVKINGSARRPPAGAGAGEPADHRDRRAGEEEPERHRPGVPHEDARRVEVERQEADARAGERGGDERRERVRTEELSGSRVEYRNSPPAAIAVRPAARPSSPSM